MKVGRLYITLAVSVCYMFFIALPAKAQGPVMEWLGPWQIDTDPDEREAGNTKVTTRGAFGASATTDGEFRDLGRAGDTGSSTGVLKAYAHVSGGRRSAHGYMDVQALRPFRLSGSPLGWKIFLEGTVDAKVVVEKYETLSAEVGAWAAVVDARCALPPLVELDIGEERDFFRPLFGPVLPCTPQGRRINRLDGVAHDDKDERRQEKPVRVSDSQGGIFPDGDYMVIARNAAGVTAGGFGHSSATADFFNPDGLGRGFVVTAAAIPLVDPSDLKIVNGYFKSLGRTNAEASLDSAKVCAPGYGAGTFTIRARFLNRSADTSISGLVFRISDLSPSAVLCNADVYGGGTGSELVAIPRDDYADGLLEPGESTEQTFRLGLSSLAEIRFYVDLLGQKSQFVANRAGMQNDSADAEAK